MEWTASRKLQLVLTIESGVTSVAEAARRYDLQGARIETWRTRALRGAERELRARQRSSRAESSLEHYVEYL